MTPFGKTNYGLREKPLQYFPPDGGLVGIFRHIGCVGDSLASGEFEGTNPDGTLNYSDMFDYSWGQYLARRCGTKVTNLSRGGMTAKWFLESFGDECGAWETAKDCDAFIIALGVNENNVDVQNLYPFGTPEDADNPGETGLGKYTELFLKLREIKPDAFFFLMTVPKQTNHNPPYDAKFDVHRAYLQKLVAKYPRTYLLDFRKYAPVYDEDFRYRYFLGSHMNAAGYLETSRMVASYIDYIIRHNMRDFRQCSFIGTGRSNTNEPDGAYIPETK